MPNHVTNGIYIPDAKKYAAAMAGVRTIKENNEKLFDFNKLIPMPETLDIEASSRGTNALALYRDALSGDSKMFDALSDGEKQLGIAYYNNLKQYRCQTWYEWRVRNWGTKWNAYDESVGDCSIWFDTAWSYPEPIIDTFAKKYELTMVHVYADENLGYYCGFRVYVDGELVDAMDFEREDADSYKFANAVMGREYDESDWNYSPEDGDYRQYFITEHIPMFEGLGL